MTNFCKSVVLLGALLLWGCPGLSRAAREKTAEKSEIPLGYEEAAKPAQQRLEKQEAGKPQKSEAEADEVEADVPVGYEDSGRATARQKQAHRRIARPAANVAEAPAKAAQRFADNPQLKAMAAQMRQQLKPLFAAELTFANAVCQPNREQLHEMKALASPELEKAITALAIQQAPQMGIGGGRGGVQQQPRDILEQFDEAASRIVSQVFPPEIAEIYQDEQRRRKEFHARAGAAALVVHLDAGLRFSPSQREALSDSLQHVWQRGWQRYLQIMASNPQFFPPVPDKAIVPHLNDVQIKQWKATQRSEIGFHWQNLSNQGLFRNMEPGIDWFENPEQDADGNGIWITQLIGAFDVMEAVDIVIDEAVEAADEQQGQ